MVGGVVVPPGGVPLINGLECWGSLGNISPLDSPELFPLKLNIRSMQRFFRTQTFMARKVATLQQYPILGGGPRPGERREAWGGLGAGGLRKPGEDASGGLGRLGEA